MVTVAQELAARGLFKLIGIKTTAPVLFRQSVDAYVESFHARNGLSRDRMNANAAREFDGMLLNITTIGRKTGHPHRIEIRLYCFEGEVYLSGRPRRKRDWYANLMANPKCQS
jgi:F420H(2)-dependent quinone reductase